MPSDTNEGKLGLLLEKTNCEHWGVFPAQDASALKHIVTEIQRFSPEELRHRFNTDTPPQDVLESVYAHALYISAIWSKTRQRLVGIGEIFDAPDNEHEISFLWSETFTRENAGLAHFLRRGLICRNLRHIMAVARERFSAHTIVAHVNSQNERAMEFLTNVAEFQESTRDIGQVTFRKSMLGNATSRLHELLLRECRDS